MHEEKRCMNNILVLPSLFDEIGNMFWISTLLAVLKGGNA